jgi:hypothetical protein
LIDFRTGLLVAALATASTAAAVDITFAYVTRLLGRLEGFETLAIGSPEGTCLMLHRRARAEQHPQQPTTPVAAATLRAAAAKPLAGALAVPADRLLLDYVHRHTTVISGAT